MSRGEHFDEHFRNVLINWHVYFSCNTFRIHLYSWEFLIPTATIHRIHYVVIADITKLLIFSLKFSSFVGEACAFQWKQAIDRWTLMASINMNMHQFFESTWTRTHGPRAMCDKTEFKLSTSWLKLCCKFCWDVFLSWWCFGKFRRHRMNWNFHFERTTLSESLQPNSMSTVYFYWLLFSKQLEKLPNPNPYR